jgi:hypothetical protein
MQELIKQSEAFLKQASQQPGYSIMVLKARRCRFTRGFQPACRRFLMDVVLGLW